MSPPSEWVPPKVALPPQGGAPKGSSTFLSPALPQAGMSLSRQTSATPACALGLEGGRGADGVQARGALTPPAWCTAECPGSKCRSLHHSPGASEPGRKAGREGWLGQGAYACLLLPRMQDKGPRCGLILPWYLDRGHTDWSPGQRGASGRDTRPPCQAPPPQLL